MSESIKTGYHDTYKYNLYNSNTYKSSTIHPKTTDYVKREKIYFNTPIGGKGSRR